jgi:hypothetical protein
MSAPNRRIGGWLLLASLPLGCSGSAKTLPGVALSEVAGAAGVAGAPEAAGSDGGAQAPRGIPLCGSPRFDAASQLVVCASGWAHRARASQCGVQASSAGSGGAPADVDGASAGAPEPSSDPESGYGVACVADSECPAGTACVCNPLDYLPDPALVTAGKGACVLATCRTDTDCGVGSYCALGNLNYLGEAVPGFGCLQAEDECTTDADCNSSDGYICLERSKRICSLPPE